MKTHTRSLARRLHDVWNRRTTAPGRPVSEGTSPAADFATRLRAAVQANQH